MSKTVTIDGVEYVERGSAEAMPELDTENFVIVRCRGAGVHAGTLTDRDEQTLELTNSRRLWRWWSKFTLSELAIDGPLPDKISEQKYARVLPRLTLTTSDVCEVIPCSEKAAKAIMEVPAWQPK